MFFQAFCESECKRWAQYSVSRRWDVSDYTHWLCPIYYVVQHPTNAAISVSLKAACSLPIHQSICRLTHTHILQGIANFATSGSDNPHYWSKRVCRHTLQQGIQQRQLNGVTSTYIASYKIPIALSNMPLSHDSHTRSAPNTTAHYNTYQWKCTMVICLTWLYTNMTFPIVYTSMTYVPNIWGVEST